jgi:hypothetical protein
MKLLNPKPPLPKVQKQPKQRKLLELPLRLMRP